MYIIIIIKKMSFGEYEFEPSPRQQKEQKDNEPSLNQLQKIYNKKGKKKTNQLSQIQKFNSLSSTHEPSSQNSSTTHTIPQCHSLLSENQQSFKQLPQSYIHFYSLIHINLIILLFLLASPGQLNQPINFNFNLNDNNIKFIISAVQLFVIFFNQFHQKRRIQCGWAVGRTRYLGLQILFILAADFGWIFYWVVGTVDLLVFIIGVGVFDVYYVAKLISLRKMQKLMDKQLKQTISLQQNQITQLN